MFLCVLLLASKYDSVVLQDSETKINLSHTALANPQPKLIIDCATDHAGTLILDTGFSRRNNNIVLPR